jgi:hypothetical protein
MTSIVLPQALFPFGGEITGPGDVITVHDGFSTANKFYSAQVGGELSYRYGIISANLTGKIAIGGTYETVGIMGSTSLVSSVVPNLSFPNGLFAQPSNNGTYSITRLTFVPEVGANLAVEVLPRVFARVGYTFLYWSSVSRPGDQIDRSINTAQLPTAANFSTGGGAVNPTALLARTDFWAQGINFGLEFRY